MNADHPLGEVLHDGDTFGLRYERHLRAPTRARVAGAHRVRPAAALDAGRHRRRTSRGRRDAAPVLAAGGRQVRDRRHHAAGPHPHLGPAAHVLVDVGPRHADLRTAPHRHRHAPGVHHVGGRHHRRRRQDGRRLPRVPRPARELLDTDDPAPVHRPATPRRTRRSTPNSSRRVRGCRGPPRCRSTPGRRRRARP